MAYIGNTAASRFVSNRAASVYSGDGSTVAFTLEQVVAQDEDVLVSVDGVVQEPSVAYAVSSGTTLTFTAAPSNNAGNNIFVYYLASQAGTIGHPSSQALSATSGTFSGAITGGGVLTTGGNVVIPNAGNIGSVGDADAMAIASNGVVTFSQNTVGAGGMDLLLDDTISSAVAQYDISSTYINGTYNSYYLEASLLPATDNVYLNSQVFVGGTVQTGSIYGNEVQRVGGSYGGANSNGSTSLIQANSAQMGNVAGEGITISMQMQNANSTTRAFCVSGISNWYYTDGNHNGSTFAGALIVANRANVVNGLRLMMSSGNIASGTVTLYGLRS